MDDETLNPIDPGDPEVVRRLEAFADARLTPSADATSRMRAGVMTAAHRQAALIEADAATAAAGSTAAAAPALAPIQAETAGWTWRRPVAAVMAGCLTIGLLAGIAYSTKAGGPLYEARLWTEMATLPSDRPARALAEVARLDQRLQEAQLASTEDDAHATEVALIAYSTIVIEAGQGVAGDTTAATTIRVTVTRHVLVLRVLVDSAPTPARAAAQQALSSSVKVLGELGGTGVVIGTSRQMGSR